MPQFTCTSPFWGGCIHVCMLSHFSHAWLCDLMDIAHETPLSVGFSRQEYWSGLPCPPPEDFPNPGTEPTSPAPSALAGRVFFLPLVPYGKPFKGAAKYIYWKVLIKNQLILGTNIFNILFFCTSIWPESRKPWKLNVLGALRILKIN